MQRTGSRASLASQAAGTGTGRLPESASRGGSGWRTDDVHQARREAPFHEAALAVSAVVRRIGIRTPRLLDQGILTDGRAWLAYAWYELTEFGPAVPSLVERAGALLAQLHAHTTAATPAGLATTSETLMDDLRKRADHLAGIAPRSGRRVRRLIPLFVEVPQTNRCVLHGDFGWRNLGLDLDGQIWLLDWDTATWGHPIVDLGKLIDREFAEDHVRDQFLRGYRQHHPVISYPWPAYVDTVRLWVAAGLLNYGRLRSVAGLTRHGLRILDEIESLARRRCGSAG
ncbi:aminoglycoside phosphotransferase family protein [Saccharopolyspora sp. NPDC050389]|uniref:aminoglycoside phosphotransferase family protein n=1 Tax=Saccharopolyspora sp. NPDC050389 TaxID=3155516 RepID=UPI0033C9EF62